jgi:hypothetical protein
MVLPPFQTISGSDLSRYIAFIMYLDIIYIKICSKTYVSRKPKLIIWNGGSTMFSTSRCNICTFDILIIHYSNIKTSIPNPSTVGTLVFSHVWFFRSDLVKSEISCLLMIHFSCL